MPGAAAQPYVAPEDEEEQEGMLSTGKPSEAAAQVRRPTPRVVAW